MSAHPPPIPPDQQSKHGAGDLGQATVAGGGPPDTPDGNLAEQGRAGNIKQNTTHPGVRSDR